MDWPAPHFEEYGQGEHYRENLRALRSRLAAETENTPPSGGG